MQAHTKIFIAACILFLVGYASWAYASKVGDHIPFDRTVYYSTDSLPNGLAILRYIIEPTDAFEHITIESYADPSINYVHRYLVLGIETDASTAILTTLFDNNSKWIDCGEARPELESAGIVFSCSGDPDTQIRVTSIRPRVIDALVKRMPSGCVYALLIAPDLGVLTIANIGLAIVLALVGLICMVISWFLCCLFCSIRSTPSNKKRVTIAPVPNDYRTDEPIDSDSDTEPGVRY